MLEHMSVCTVRRSWPALSLLLALTLCACSRGGSTAPSPAAAPPADPTAASSIDENDLIVPDYMDLVVDPAASVVLAAADRHAWTDFEPRSEEAWQAIADAASQLAQSADMLSQPALARGRADWSQSVGAMAEG